MTPNEIKELAQKYHTPGDRVNERWNPLYQEECRKINRNLIEGSLMNKYNVFGEVNKEVKRSVLFARMGKTEH